MQAKQNRGNNNRQPTPSTSKQAEEVRLRVDHVRVSVTQPKALILNPSTLINLSEGLEEFIQPILPTEDSHIADLSLLFNSGWLFFFQTYCHNHFTYPAKKSLNCKHAASSTCADDIHRCGELG